MKFAHVVLVVVPTLALAAGVVTFAQPESKQPEKRPTPEQLWDEASSTGPEHLHLAKLVGEWDQTVRVFEAGKVVMESKGSVFYKSILGGRFIVENASTKLGDMPFDWMSVYGFDKSMKKFTASWFDNLDTTTETATGTLNEDTTVLTFTGTHQNPGSGRDEVFKWVMTWEPDCKTVRISMIEPGKDGKDKTTVEIVQTKK